MFNFIANVYKTNTAEYNPENILKTSFCTKMLERKIIQTSVEPAENKSISSVDVNCTICELAVWHNYLNGRASFACRRQTDGNFSPLHGATTGIIFTYTLFELV